MINVEKIWLTSFPWRKQTIKYPIPINPVPGIPIKIKKKTKIVKNWKGTKLEFGLSSRIAQ